MKYLRENKGATIHEVSNETKVSIKQITSSLEKVEFPCIIMPNMGYPCEVCGIIIREGGICDECRKRLAKDVNTSTSKTIRERRRTETKTSPNL